MLNIGLILQTGSKCTGSPRTRPKGTELGPQAAGPGHPRMAGVPAPPPRSLLHRARSLSWMDTFPKCTPRHPGASWHSHLTFHMECPWSEGRPGWAASGPSPRGASERSPSALRWGQGRGTGAAARIPPSQGAHGCPGLHLPQGPVLCVSSERDVPRGLL